MNEEWAIKNLSDDLQIHLGFGYNVVIYESATMDMMWCSHIDPHQFVTFYSPVIQPTDVVIRVRDIRLLPYTVRTTINPHDTIQVAPLSQNPVSIVDSKGYMRIP